MLRSTSSSFFDQSSQFASFKDFDTLNDALQSVGATVDEKEPVKDRVYNSKLEES